MILTLPVILAIAAAALFLLVIIALIAFFIRKRTTINVSGDYSQVDMRGGSGSETPNFQPRKVVFVGPTQGGKTAIWERILGNEFDSGLCPTNGVEFYNIEYTKLNNSSANFKVGYWDIPGQTRFLSFIPAFINSANYIVYVIHPELTSKQHMATIGELNKKFPAGSRLLIVVGRCDEIGKENNSSEGVKKKVSGNYFINQTMF